MRTFLFGMFTLVAAASCTGDIGIVGDDDMGGGPPPTDVQITVRDATLPQANVEVIFQNLDDSIIADVVTDAQGLAVAQMPNGGNVTVIRTYPQPAPPASRAAEVYSYVGVKAGDRLVLGHPIAVDAPPNAINVVVPDGANGTVNVVTACGSGQGTAPNVPITLKGCSPTSFYVMDGDGASFFAHAAYSENVDLSQQVLLPALSSSLSATNVPTNTQVTIEKQLAAEGYVLFSSDPKRVDQTPTNVNIPSVTGVDQIVITEMTNADNRTQMVASHAPFAAGPSIVDASVGMIAYISDASTFTAPNTINWVEESPGAADMVLTTLSVTRGGPAMLNNTYVRRVIAPYGTTVRMPLLPGAGFDYNPQADDQVDVALGLVKATGGYDAIRAHAFNATSLTDITPMSGQLTVSYANTLPSL
jgi:hypothetical protein